MKLPPVALLCILSFSASTPAAAPPRRDDPLPAGAVLRLGYARMVADRGYAVVSPDGQWVYSGRWYDLADGQAKKGPVQVPERCSLERFFSDGSYVIYSNGRLLFSPKSDKPVIRIEIADQVQAFDHTGKFGVQVFAEQEGSEIALVDLRHGSVRKGRRVLVQTKCESGGADLSDHGKHVVWIDFTEPRALTVHDVAAAKQRRILLPKDFKYPWATISRDGRFVCCRSGQRATLYDAATGKLIRQATGLTGDNRSGGQFTADGKAWTVQCDRGLVFVPTDPSKPIQTRPVWVSAIFPDWRRGIAIDSGGVLRVIDLQSGKQLDRYSRFGSFDGLQLLDGHRVATWGHRGQVVLWDLRDGRVLSETTIPPPKDGGGQRIRFSRDGKILAALATGGQAGVLADVRTGKVLAELPGHAALSADFDARGNAFVVTQPTSDEKTTVLWLNRPDDASRQIPIPSGQVLPAPDGRSFVVANGRSISLFEAVTGRERWKKDVPQMRLNERAAHELLLATRDRRGRIVTVRQRDVALLDAVTGRTLGAFLCNGDTDAMFRLAAVSASGRWLAMLEGEENGLRVFDLDAEDADRPILTHQLPTGHVTGLALTDDGSRLISAHANGTCLVWDLQALRPTPRKQETDAWQMLSHVDPREAQPAIASLTRNRDAAVKLLATKLKPVAEVPPARIAAWVRELDDDVIGRRAGAEKGLSAAGDQAEAALRRAMKEPASVEQRLRVQRLLKRLDPATDAGHLRQVRAIEILEIIGTREAMAVLERVARGAEAARLTREARASLERLKRKGE